MTGRSEVDVAALTVARLLRDGVLRPRTPGTIRSAAVAAGIPVAAVRDAWAQLHNPRCRPHLPAGECLPAPTDDVTHRRPPGALRAEVLRVLLDGGPVTSPEGRATTLLRQRLAWPAGDGHVSTVVRRLEQEGMVTRDLNGKWCLRIGLTEAGWDHATAARTGAAS